MFVGNDEHTAANNSLGNDQTINESNSQVCNTFITSEAKLQTTGLHVFLKTLEKTSFTKILHEFQMRSRVILEHVMNVDLFVVNIAV